MKVSLFTAALSLFATEAVASVDGKCRALVLSGGGTNGAWEAGVLWGLMNYGDPADFAYDTVSGISAGALNTAGIAGFRPEQGLEMGQFLSDRWAHLTNDQVYQDWPGGLP